MEASIIEKYSTDIKLPIVSPHINLKILKDKITIINYKEITKIDNISKIIPQHQCNFMLYEANKSNLSLTKYPPQ